MANELNIVLQTGKTITADIVNGVTVVASNISLTERGSTGHYHGNITGLAAGNYLVTFKEGSNILGTGSLYWDGSKEVINKLDVDVSTRASQSSVNSIPTNPLLATDSRLNNLDTTISSRASQTSLNNSLTTIELIRKLITNSSKIDETTNKLIVYDDDEITPILQFNTLNIDGVASTSQIFEIRKI